MILTSKENKSELKGTNILEYDDNEDSNLQLKVEKGVDEKKSKTLSSNVYDPELDLSNYKYPKVDLLKAEAISEMINADSAASLRNSIINFSGGLNRVFLSCPHQPSNRFKF